MVFASMGKSMSGYFAAESTEVIDGGHRRIKIVEEIPARDGDARVAGMRAAKSRR